MSNDLIRSLGAQGHHREADEIERREILLELRAEGTKRSHALADAIERGTPIAADGRINVDALRSRSSVPVNCKTWRWRLRSRPTVALRASRAGASSTG